MENQIIAIITDVLKISEDELKANFDEKTIWDSLQKVEIVFALEEELGIELEPEELERVSTPKSLLEIATNKI